MLMDVYGVLGEAAPCKAVDVFDKIMARKEETNLAYYRKMRGLSQSKLAKASGVSIRSIQLFEQRKSNINNAQYNHLSAIAKVLGLRDRGIIGIGDEWQCKFVCVTETIIQCTKKTHCICTMITGTIIVITQTSHP